MYGRDKHTHSYSNKTELEDGRTLTLTFWSRYICSGHPENDSGDTYFRIDGNDVDRDDVPLTDDEIRKLEEDATIVHDEY